MYRSLFIQTKPTPNPSSLKFCPGKEIMPNDQTMDFSSIRFTHISPLARRLFQVDGVTRVFFGRDFISVTKKEDVDWATLKPDVLEVITDHLTKSQPILSEDAPQSDDTVINDDDSEAVAMIKEIIETRIRPFVQEDGGDVRFMDFNEETGHVRLQMKGSCAGCPSSAVTLKNGIENMLKHYVPEVETIEGVDEVLE